MIGAIAQAYYKHIPTEIIEKASIILDDHLLKITNHFPQIYHIDI